MQVIKKCGSWLACDGGLLVVYISVAAVTASIGSALTAGHFCKDRNAGPDKSNQKVFAPTLG
ncbi:hypothetical protein, partial [Pseudomonas sp. PA-5-4G]|uniref:hypothetical protein n=1 Tax=Pseudomonas sp. PA-5-4G TaxID=2665479 RepID=UPI001F32A413